MAQREVMAAGLVACVVALAGCMSAGNDRAAVGGVSTGVVLADVGQVVDRSERPLASSGKSVEGLGRGNWAPVNLVVPVDGVACEPLLLHEVHWTRTTARQRGGPVTPMSALEQEGGTMWVQAEEAAAAPFLAIYDTVAVPVRVFEHVPWREERRLPRSYWRTLPGVAVSVGVPAKGEP